VQPADMDWDFRLQRVWQKHIRLKLKSTAYPITGLRLRWSSRHGKNRISFENNNIAADRNKVGQRLFVLYGWFVSRETTENPFPNRPAKTLCCSPAAF